MDSTDDQITPAPLLGPQGIGAAVLLALAIGLLPVWDAVDDYRSITAFASLGLSSSGPSLGAVVVRAAVAAVIGFAFAQVAAGDAARVVFAVAAVWVVGHGLVTAVDTARTRSGAIDSWNVCEDPGVNSQGHSTHVGNWSFRSSFEGPHLPGGDPCIHEHERRDLHAEQHPNGDVMDGLVQISKRFPKDRNRVFGGLPVVVMLLVAAGLLGRGRFAQPKPRISPDSETDAKRGPQS